MSKYQLKEKVLDATEVIALRNSAGWHNLSKEKLQKALDKSVFFASIYFNNEPVAMGRIIGDGYQYFYLQDVIVLPEHQKNGLGWLITENLVNRVKAIAEGGEFFGLMAAEGVAPFYERFGFQYRTDEMPGMGMYLEKS